MKYRQKRTLLFAEKKKLNTEKKDIICEHAVFGGAFRNRGQLGEGLRPTDLVVVNSLVRRCRQPLLQLVLPVWECGEGEVSQDQRGLRHGPDGRRIGCREGCDQPQQHTLLRLKNAAGVLQAGFPG